MCLVNYQNWAMDLEFSNVCIRTNTHLISAERVSGGWFYVFPGGKGQYGWADFYPDSQANIQDLKNKSLNGGW